ncbi:molybdate ABC transporter substrate-binding protein [Microbulbifer bruguierae]|uniref:Molybdate ABC transporter substrate-binding protein n=1 Tax=Microbulbifer bruguierae TaxID=3029061 RepID=A0ABY8NHF5_9GAMM|nr:molybdate ABC transporter substrate-binding protein [Microbulbifer bruguierae]WGL17132.1 molybdate ABC transporter substrate-binding protein [Microbulbifer bruguierae]
MGIVQAINVARAGLLLMISSLAVFSLGTARAEELTVAVASNFTAPMKEIAARFEANSDHRVKLAFGSSGKFFAQISHGAPYQAFFSADQSKPARLVELGLARADSRFTYAEGQLALWSAKPDFVDPHGEVLKRQQFKRLAFANPKLAPYGVAAVEVLERLNLLEQTRGRWVQGENISQTYQFIASGNAELGFVALSQIQHDDTIKRGSAWILPRNLYNPIRQDAVILREGAKVSALADFWQFLQSAEARAIIQSYGYTPESGNGTE